MAYFSNSSEGECLFAQCEQCIFGELPCPIFNAQLNHNYSACNNKEAREILDELIDNSGNCTMWNEFRNVLDVDINPEYAQDKYQLKIRQLDMLKKVKENAKRASVIQTGNGE